MTSGDFLTGLEALVRWLGNLLLPVVAAYCVVMAIVALHNRSHWQRYILGALYCLMGPGLASLAEAFITSSPVGAHDVYYNAILSGINWLGNVIMPMFAAYNVICGVLVLGGFMERLDIGDDWVRYFVTAIASLLVSGIMRLLEWFVVRGESTGITGHFAYLVHGSIRIWV